MKQAIKIIVVIVVLVVGVFFAIRYDLPTLLSNIVEEIRTYGIVAPLLFALLYILTAVLMIPGSILTLIAGYIFGLGSGIVLISISSTLGATAAFFISRYLLRGWLERKFSKNRSFYAIDSAIREKGWVIVGLLRLSPLVPYNLANYLFGLTGVRAVPYILASWIAMLPGTAAYVWIGSLAEDLSSAATRQGRSPLEWALFVFGLCATLFVTFYISYTAKKIIRRHLDLDAAEGSEDPNK